jgi:hypothetical protein
MKILAGLMVLALIAIFVISRTWRHHWISLKVEQGDAAAVLAYLNANIKDHAAWGDVEFAFQQATATHSDKLLAGMEQIILGTEAPTETRNKLLHLFAQRQIVFQRASELLGCLLDGQISGENADDARTVLRTLPTSNRLNALTSQIIPLEPYLLTSDIVSRDSHALEMAKSLLPERRSSFEKLENLLSAAKGAWDQIGGLRQELENLKNKNEKNSEAFKSLPNNMWSSPLVLQGFVVAEQESHWYEVAMAGNLAQHALLLTTSTEFRTKGYFTMEVEPNTVDLPIKLKEEVGGFTQNWKIYTECDIDCKNRREEGKARWAVLRRTGDELENQIRELRSKIVAAAQSYSQFPAIFDRETCLQLPSCKYPEPGFYVVSGDRAEFIPMRWKNPEFEELDSYPANAFSKIDSGASLILYGAPQSAYSSDMVVVPYARRGAGSELTSLDEKITPHLALKDFFHMEQLGTERGWPLHRLTPAKSKSGYFEARTSTNDASNNETQPRSILFGYPGETEVPNTVGVREGGHFSGAKLVDLQTKLSHNWGHVLEMPEVQACSRRVFGSDFQKFIESMTGPGEATAQNGILLISACKAHLCPDASAILTMDLNDLKGAGAIQDEQSITVYLGSYDVVSLPQQLRDWLKNQGREIHYQK